MRVVTAIVFWLAIGTTASTTIADAASPGSVIVLNQSTSYRPWPTTIITELRSVITRGTDGPTPVYIEHLDLYRFNGPRYRDTLRSSFRHKYSDKPISVIVTIGTAALDYGLDLQASLWPDAALVFAAVDGKTAELDRRPGVTGLTMQMTLTDMVHVARTLLPDTKRFALVGDRLGDQLYYSQFSEELTALARDVDFIDITGEALSEVEQRIATLPEHTAILYIGINSDRTKKYLPAEVIPLLVAVANRPIFVNVETYFGFGAVGGALLSPARIGKEAGRLVLRILAGENAADIPITSSNSLTPIFDWRQLRRWHISESRLPPGSEVRFRTPSVWEQYRAEILAVGGALLVQVALIAGLLHERRRRRLSEGLARETMSELAHVNRMATAGELSASIAHEVTQPLTGIVSSANAAARWLSATTPDIDRAKAALSQIAAAGHRASDIVRSIRSALKRTTEDRQPVDINDLIASVIAFAQIDLDRNRVRLDTQFDTTLPQVSCDPVQLQQVVLNLIMNAVDSMATVEDRARILRIKTERRKTGEVMVSVDDTGAGIAPENVDRIFKPLFTTKSRGMGMGLAICRSIIEAHDGRIWASASGQRGSVFRFTLPTQDARS